MGSVNGHDVSGPLPAVVANVTLEAVRRYARACEEADHDLCDGGFSCAAVEDLLEWEAESDNAARAFDVGVLAAGYRDGEPTVAWPTTALLRLVRDRLEQPPWGPDAFRRSVLITSALARLGERGIPADAIVRLCMGPALQRRITFQLVSAELAVRRGDASVDRLPWQLRAWLPALEDLRSIEEPGSLAMAALSGSLAQEMAGWIDRGALAHLIAWRRDADRVDIDHEDRVLPGGLEASRWLFDRFTRTGLDDWRRASLTWELAFAQRPEEVARRAGVPVGLLAERPMSREMVVEAIARRVCAPSADDPVLADMTLTEVIENLAALVKMAELDTAVALAQRAVVAVPHSVEMAVAAAFLLIPEAPAKAEESLRRLMSRPGAPVALLRANLTSALVRQRNLGAAERVLEELTDASSAQPAWLWAPRSIVAGRAAELAEYTLRDWCEEMSGVLAESSQSAR